ncbi:hypothetical protein Q427_06735 [Halomonas sp. BC04]|nr:hypothetical protein Q427_06735 [Halomonas sp. BC04]
MQDAPQDVHNNEWDQLALFGQFSLTLGDDVLNQFSYDKVKALLVYLLLHQQPINRASLAELLWPDQGLSSGRTNLRHALHCLRQSLGEEAERVLVVSRQTIAFRLPESWHFDLHELQRLLEGPRISQPLSGCFNATVAIWSKSFNCLPAPSSSVGWYSCAMSGASG